MNPIVDIVSNIFAVFLGSGLVTYYFKNKMDSRLQKSFFRHENIYSCRLATYNELCYLFVKSEKQYNYF